MALLAETKLDPRESCYPLSALQQGMLFDALRSRQRGVDVTEVVVHCKERLEPALMEQACQALAERHDILRTSFRWENLAEPRQVVQPKIRIPVSEKDWTELPVVEQNASLEALLKEERRQGFELSVAPLMRVVLIRRAAAEFTMVWIYHHILLDARSLGILLKELFGIYEDLKQGALTAVAGAKQYHDYIDWLQRQDWSKAETFWRKRFEGFGAATPLTETFGFAKAEK